MSVKITRHEEKRTTSIKNFILSACIPLLFVGTFGYMIGINNAGDAQRSAQLLANEQRRADKAEREVKAIRQLLRLTDSVRQRTLDINEEIIKEYQRAEREEASEILEQPVVLWFRGAGKAIRRLETEFGGAYSRMEEDPNQRKSDVDIVKTLYQDYLGSISDNVTALKRNWESRGVNKSNFSSLMQDRESEFQTEKSRLEQKLVRMEGQIQSLQRDKETLNDRLDARGIVKCPDYSNEVNTVIAAFDDIRANVDALDEGKIFTTRLLTSKKRSQKEQELIDELKRVKVEVDKICTKASRTAEKIEY